MSIVNKIGILDPDGNNLNPLNGNPYSDQYKALSKVWSKYPAYERAEDIITKIEQNQVILIVAQTGSGKTVLVPKFAAHVMDYKKNIAITLPKQIIAKSAAEFAAKTLDVKLGDEVGYQYKGSNAKSGKTKLLYATDGTIVARLLKDPTLQEFDVVIIDEAHERKVQIDFLFYLLRNTIKLRPEFKLIIMSATINAKIFENYFADYQFEIIDIGGARTFPIDSIFLDKSISKNDYLDEGYNILKKIVKTDNVANKGSHDILFFVTSVNEATDICGRISSDKLNGYCVEVYSGMNNEKEEIARDKLLYKTVSDKARKIVIATPVAESSLTIDGIKYVIDSGYEFNGYYDPENDARVLDKKLITKAQARQRMGRSGRTEPGVCYHLYTQDDFNNKMEPFPEPNIRTSDISSECLKLLMELKTNDKLTEVLRNFIEPPKDKYINSAIKHLKDLQVVDDLGITKFGEFISNLQMDPMGGCTVYAAKQLKCSREVLKILAVIDATKGNMSELFREPKMVETSDGKMQQNSGMMKKFKEAKGKFKNRYGDHIAMLDIMEGVLKVTDDKFDDYCYKYFLNRGALIKAKGYFQRTKYSVGSRLNDIKELEGLHEVDIASKVVAAFAFGYKYHRGFLHGDNYNTLYSSNIKLSRDSMLHFNANLPKEIVYNELFNGGGKMELNLCSAITPKVEEIIGKIIIT